MNFRPCIDIHNGKVKQIVGSTLKDNSEKVVENFVSDMDSKYYAKMFMSDNLKGGHVIMLGPNNENQALLALNTFKQGFHIGGGINADNADFYLKQGASHVIITSYLFNNGVINIDNLEKIKARIGKKKLVIDLSCKRQKDKYFVVTNRWQTMTEFEINSQNIDWLSNYCDEFLIHAADVEGQCIGIDKELVKKLGQFVKIPTTYAGGVKNYEDIIEVYKLGQNKIDLTIGSALDIFGGKLEYKEVIRIFNSLP